MDAAPETDHTIRAVLFDLDGTLVESAGEISTALDETFRELGVEPLALGAVESLVGRGVRSLVERALDARGARGIDFDTAVARFEAHYSRIVGTAARLYPGVREGLRSMHGAGWKLAVVTNKPRLFTQRLLVGLDIAALFAAVVAGDDGIRRKPAGDMLRAACEVMGARIDETLMLGDSDNDVLAAREAGCFVWCVPYGYNEGRPAESLACDRIVATLEEAAELLIGSRPVAS
jgi:phosphoglycolate phosphatase